jgi:hypothetical protein
MKGDGMETGRNLSSPLSAFIRNVGTKEQATVMDKNQIN